MIFINFKLTFKIDCNFDELLFFEKVVGCLHCY